MLEYHNEKEHKDLMSLLFEHCLLSSQGSRLEGLKEPSRLGFVDLGRGVYHYVLNVRVEDAEHLFGLASAPFLSSTGVRILFGAEHPLKESAETRLRQLQDRLINTCPLCHGDRWYKPRDAEEAKAQSFPLEGGPCPQCSWVEEY